MNTEIGDRIARLRIDLGIGQTAAGEAAGISQPTWSRIEAGTREPTLGEVVGISRALGCMTSTVLGRGEVLDRLQTAARTETQATGVDSSIVVERLGFFLDLDAQMREAGVGSHNVS